MACESFREDLQAYLDGELAPPRRAALEVHLAQCSECAGVLDELRTVSASLARWKDREPSDRFQFMMQFRLSTENLPSQGTKAPRAADGPEAAPARRVRAKRPASLTAWLTTGWRPVAAVAGGLLFLVAVVALWEPAGGPRPLRPAASVDMVRAFLEAGPGGELSEAYIYAANAAKKAVEADKLRASRVASAEVVYSFLASMDSAGEKSAGWRLINLLSRKRRAHRATVRAEASIFKPCPGLLFTDVYASTGASSALLAGRRYELQGRLREALARYSMVDEGAQALRGRLALGALRLRMGDLEGARRDLEAACEAADAIVRNSALALLGEIENARRARDVLARQRQSAATAREWFLVGVMEVRAYDFRNAANSFMKATNAAGKGEEDLAREARFRSAWCQKEIGQITTAIYGFRTLADEGAEMDELRYSSGIIEAVALSRIGRHEESVQACRRLLQTSPPESIGDLEALAYFQKGCVELRYLGDINAASESLGRVASGGRGNLSFAAQYLLQSSGR